MLLQRPIRMRFRTTAATVLLFAMLAAIGGAIAPPAARAGVRVVESDASRVILEILPDEPRAVRAGPAAQYIRLRIPGLGMTEETGFPEIPAGAERVAVPPGTTPVLNVLREEWSQARTGAIHPVPERIGVRDPFGASRVVEQDPVEAPAYRTRSLYPDEPFRLSSMGDLRGLRVVDVIWHAARAEPSSGSYRVLRSALLEVAFRRDPQPRATRAPPRPAGTDRLWERTRRASVSNAAAARDWVRGTPGDAPSVGDAPWGGGTQVRVRIDRTGIVRLTHAAISAAGFPSGIPVAEISVYQRSFLLDSVDDPAVAARDLFVPIAVPVLVRDDGNGVFDGSDSILLYGRSFQDQWMTSGFEHEDGFQGDNFYWVRRDPSGGARMTQRASQPAAPAADSLDSTPSTVRREADLRYMERPPDSGAGSEAFESEFYFWNNSRTLTGHSAGWTLSDPFDVADPVPGRAATLVARVLPGGRPLFEFNTNICDYTVNGTSLGQDTFYNRNLYSGGIVPPQNVLWTHAIPAGVLFDGTNTFTFRGRSYEGSSTTTTVGNTRFLLDRYEITYDRQLRARGGELLLGTDHETVNDSRIRVQGFSGADVLLLDVTAPGSPEHVAVDPGQVVPAGGGLFDLRFGHPVSQGVRRYLAFRDGDVSTVAAADVSPQPAPGLMAGGAGARWVAVTHEDFLTGTRDLAAHRAARHSTLVVPLQEVWDVFGMGGRDPRALKAFAAWAYHRWTDPIAFLCLVGDASEDHRGVDIGSDPDYLPSHSLWAQYEGSPEESDQYYAEVTRALPGQPFDELSDIYVGRLAVGNEEELAWNVERMVRYETEDPDGAWRRRVLLLADDAISGNLGGATRGQYGFRDGELEFCESSSFYVDSLLSSSADALLPELMCMSQWSHPCTTSCYECTTLETSTCGDGLCDPDTIDCETRLGMDCGIWYDCRTSGSCDPDEWQGEHLCARQEMKTLGLPALRSRLNAGALIWNFQGHANRFFLTHEEIWYDAPFGGRHDVQTLNNYGKPFIFLGFACHLAEFDDFDEGTNEDCLSEKMMNVRQFDAEVPGGCVASFSSSGFEFLTPNLDFNEFVMDAFFRPERSRDPGNLAGGGSTLPDVDDGPVYRWTLGESTTRSRLMFQQRWAAASGQTRQAAQRFVLLGDPALEPNVGSPELSVTVNGQPVEDPREAFVLDPAVADLVDIEVTAVDGRGIASWAVLDSQRGEVSAQEYEILTQGPGAPVVTPDGVAVQQTLRYTFQSRNEDYTVSISAMDGGGFAGRFDLRLTGAFEFSGGEPAVYPSPFQDETWFVYRMTGQARTARVNVYTVSGRRIRSLHEGFQPANTQLKLSWDGRDENGQDVANGTYFFVFESHAASGDETVRKVLPVVKMR